MRWRHSFSFLGCHETKMCEEKESKRMSCPSLAKLDIFPNVNGGSQSRKNLSIVLKLFSCYFQFNHRSPLTHTCEENQHFYQSIQNVKLEHLHSISCVCFAFQKRGSLKMK
jgi:hypothetical protein